MQVRLMRLEETATTRWYNEGSPSLHWDLTRAQAEFVTRFGLPETFKAEVRNRMAEEAWTATGGQYRRRRYRTGQEVPDWP